MRGAVTRSFRSRVDSGGILFDLMLPPVWGESARPSRGGGEGVGAFPQVGEGPSYSEGKASVSTLGFISLFQLCFEVADSLVKLWVHRVAAVGSDLDDLAESLQLLLRPLLGLPPFPPPLSNYSRTPRSTN